MNIFKRLFKIGEAEANSAIDNMEDPIKLTEQGIRDMKQDLDKSLEALAQVKALAIRAKNDQEQFQDKAEDYQSKAIVILKKAHNKQMDAAEADRLAKEALMKKEEAQKQVDQAKAESEKFDGNVAQLQKNIQNKNKIYLEKLSSINLIVSLILKSKMNVPNLGPFFCPNKIS